MVGHLFHHEVTHPATIEVIDIVVTVITWGFQGEEQGFFRKTK